LRFIRSATGKAHEKALAYALAIGGAEQVFSAHLEKKPRQTFWRTGRSLGRVTALMKADLKHW
jgi:ketol-acid reductoisomerase